MRVLVRLYETTKYEAAEKSHEIEYDKVVGFKVVAGRDADQIEAESNGFIDEYHEYLVIEFENGETSTFRNSHVDLFKLF